MHVAKHSLETNPVHGLWFTQHVTRSCYTKEEGEL